MKQELESLRIQFNKLKSYFMALKEEMTEIEFFDFDEYEVSKVIGEGATSSVHIVFKKSKDKYAMKELKESDHKTVQRFLTECGVLFKLRHPCIIRIYGFNYGDDEHPPSIILSLEPTSLEKAIQKKELNDAQKCKIAVELVLGMRYVHRRKFMHRDLKPSNILLSQNNHVRISDFGLAKEENLETLQTKGVGTLLFMAPELLEEGDDDVASYTNKVDVYSFGITLIFIVTENYPKFSLRNVSKGIIPPLPARVVSWVRDLITRCLSLDPENRPSFDEIFEIMRENNFDIFNESKGQKLTSMQLSMKKEIEERILKIEAFEYLHQDD